MTFTDWNVGWIFEVCHPGQWLKMQGHFFLQHLHRRTKLSSLLLARAETACLSYQCYVKEARGIYSLPSIKSAKSRSSLPLTSRWRWQLQSLMHSFLMEYHKSGFRAAKVKAAILVEEMAAFPESPEAPPGWLQSQSFRSVKNWHNEICKGDRQWLNPPERLLSTCS